MANKTKSRQQNKPRVSAVYPLTFWANNYLADCRILILAPTLAMSYPHSFLVFPYCYLTDPFGLIDIALPLCIPEALTEGEGLSTVDRPPHYDILFSKKKNI
jgi:hypothetical protein